MFTARFHFLPESAPDFLDDGREVVEMEFESIEEVVTFTQEFASALKGTLVYNQDSQQVVDLADFTV